MDETNVYACKDIVVLEGLGAVRRRPGMYMGADLILTLAAAGNLLVW